MPINDQVPLLKNAGAGNWDGIAATALAVSWPATLITFVFFKPVLPEINLLNFPSVEPESDNSLNSLIIDNFNRNQKYFEKKIKVKREQKSINIPFQKDLSWESSY